MYTTQTHLATSKLEGAWQEITIIVLTKYLMTSNSTVDGERLTFW